jgi:glucosylceramidase
MVFRTPTGKQVIIAANLQNVPQTLTVKMGNKYLSLQLDAHSLNTFEVN